MVEEKERNELSEEESSDDGRTKIYPDINKPGKDGPFIVYSVFN